MGDNIPVATRAFVPRMPTMIYAVSGCRVLAEGWLHENSEHLATVNLTLQPKKTRSEADILRDALIEHYIALVARKLSVRLSRHIAVDINTFRPPSYNEFLTGYEGPLTDALGKLYAECRGLSASILWMLHKDFPKSFCDD